MGGGTGGGVGPAGPGGIAGGMRGGGLPAFTRQSTSLRRLKIEWDTYVKVGEERLDADAAYREVRGRDPRPVLLLRDCDACTGKDDALLERSMEDEKILLASSWFHCIRVDKGVLKDNHPLNALFVGGDQVAPHMILFSADGAERIGLPGKPTAKKLWNVMNKILVKDYVKPADAAIARWIALLSRFDALDARLQELTTQREATDDAKKVGSIEKELKTTEDQLAKARRDEIAVRDLGLRGGARAQAVDYDAEAAEAVRGANRKGSLIDKVKKPEPAPTTGTGETNK